MPDTTTTTTTTIYHNPKCGTSRNVLEMIKNSGAEPQVIEYLKTPLNAEQLQELVTLLGIPVRDLLRQNGAPYDELSLAKAHWTDEELIEKMAEHPMLMNRPVVVTPLGAKLCRPAEAVLDILPVSQQDASAQEGGEVVEPEEAPDA